MSLDAGYLGVLKLDGSADTLVDISTYLDSAKMNRNVAMLDVSTLGDQNQDFIPGLKGGVFPLTGKFDATADALFDADLAKTTSRSFEYGPKGSTSGLVKYTGECWVEGYDVDTAVGSEGKFTASLRITGAVTRTTWA